MPSFFIFSLSLSLSTHTRNAWAIFFSSTFFQPLGEETSRPTANDVIPVGYRVPVKTGK